eukprot:COSAG01_NODE_8829_length_2646_cov_1.828818_2_plen_134_part_00
MGSPAMPQFGVPIDQFPGVSLLDWETGRGNAKYWVLMLLLEHFAPADTLWQTTTAAPGGTGQRQPAQRTQCDADGVWCGYKPFCGGSQHPSYSPVSRAIPDEMLAVAQPMGSARGGAPFQRLWGAGGGGWWPL